MEPLKSGIEHPVLWVVVRGGSPSLQALALAPERRAAMLGKAFVSLNTLFAELYLASASHLHGRGVSELLHCKQTVTLENLLLSPGRRKCISLTRREVPYKHKQ